MRVLLDSHILIWAVAATGRLGKAVIVELEDPANEVLFSAASIWEIAIKYQLRRPDFIHEPNQIAQAALATGFVELAVRATTAAVVATLPALHRDPFDRLLIAQAMTEPALLYTADPQLLPYSDLVRRVG